MDTGTLAGNEGMAVDLISASHAAFDGVKPLSVHLGSKSFAHTLIAHKLDYIHS